MQRRTVLFSGNAVDGYNVIVTRGFERFAGHATSIDFARLLQKIEITDASQNKVKVAGFDAEFELAN